MTTPAAELLQVADAVVTALNSASFNQAHAHVGPGSPPAELLFTAVRLYRPQFELADLATLHVTVVPRGVEMEAVSRSQVAYDYKVDVAVQQKFAEGGATDLDPLMLLVEQIADLFRLKRLDGYAAAVWVKTENVPVYVPEHIEQFRQFTSVLTFAFRVVR